MGQLTWLHDSTQGVLREVVIDVAPKDTSRLSETDRTMIASTCSMLTRFRV